MSACGAHARSAAAAWVTLALATGCAQPTRSGPSVEVARRWSVPANDEGSWCEDTTDLRVCWDSRGEASRVARTVPAFAAPTPLGFRCSGQGGARVCEARDGAGRFECEGARCTQRHPRLPGDGEWECSDDAGVTVCTGGEPPSGVASSSTAAGWICGPRRQGPPSAGPRGATVCVDLSPDFPDGRATGLRCTWTYDHGVTRICTRDPDAHVLGDACDGRRPCVVGARCAAGRCVPPRPAPACSLDADCEGASCRFGSCVAVAP